MPDAEPLFWQQFRRDLRVGRFTMEVAQDGPAALELVNDANATLTLRSDIGPLDNYESALRL